MCPRLPLLPGINPTRAGKLERNTSWEHRLILSFGGRGGARTSWIEIGGAAWQNAKYELTDIARVISNAELGHETILRRIRALRDIPRHGVKEGQLGGWIECESNLSQDGDCWVGNEARVYGRAKVRDNALVADFAIVYVDALVMGNATVRDNALIFGSATVRGNATIQDTTMVGDNAEVNEDATEWPTTRIWVVGRGWAAHPS